MDLDENELKATKKRNGFKTESLTKEEISKVFRNHIWEMNNDEWNFPNAEKVKFYCEEELESVLFKLLKMGE